MLDAATVTIPMAVSTVLIGWECVQQNAQAVLDQMCGNVILVSSMLIVITRENAFVTMAGTVVTSVWITMENVSPSVLISMV